MTTFASMTALSVAIGLLFGGSTSLSVVLLVDCVGMNRLASIMALTQCIQAFIFLGTGPFMGEPSSLRLDDSLRRDIQYSNN